MRNTVWVNFNEDSKDAAPYGSNIGVGFFGI
jgi:hypothetical protein